MTKQSCERCQRITRSREKAQWIILTPSGYVINSLARDWETWRSNGWRKADGNEPANLKLLKRLYALIREWERRYGVDISLCKLSSWSDNPAKELAREGAREEQREAR